MKKKHTTLMIKVDKVLRDDLVEIRELALLHGAPRHATVSIRTDATGTTVVFEWVANDSLTDKEKAEIYGWKSVDKRYPNYYAPGSPYVSWEPKKPKKPF